MNPTVDTHARHYPPGVTPDLVGGVPTMRDAWDRHVLERPQAPAVHYFDATLTFAEVDDAAAALASALAARGVVRGDRVAVYLQNDPQWLVTMLAAWKLGAVPVAVNPMLRAKELVHHLTDSSPVALVCLDSLYAEVVREVLGQTEVRVVVTTHPLDLTPGATLPDGVAVHVPPRRTFDDALDWHELLREHAGERPATVALSSEDIGVLTYTSGTTGRSKGAMNLHGAMVHSSTMYTAWWDLQPERDVVVGLAPVFHITGIIAGLGVHVLSGAPLVLMHRFDAGQTLRAIEQHRGTFMIAASTAFIALSNHPDLERHDVSSLTKTPSGGAPVSQALVDRVRERTGWVLRGAYGMTETTSPTHLGAPQLDPPVAPGVRPDGRPGLLAAPGGVGARHPRRLAAHGGHRQDHRGRLAVRGRPPQGPHQRRRLQGRPARRGGRALRPPRRPGGLGGGGARRVPRGDGQGVRLPGGRRPRRPGGAHRVLP